MFKGPTYLEQFLSFSDLFAQPINLLINKHQHYHTSIGSFISISILVITAFTFINLVQNNEDLPFTRQYTQQVKDPFTLKVDDFQFQVTVADEQGLQLTQKYRTAFLQACSIIQQQQTDGKVQMLRNCTQVQLVPCTETARGQEMDNVPRNMVPSQPQLCLPNSNTSDTSQTISTSYSILIRKCTNSSDSLIGTFIQINIQLQSACSSEMEIQNKLRKGYIGISFINNMLTHSSSEQPFTKILEEQVLPFSANSVKYVNIYFQNTIVQTIHDFFYFFDWISTTNALQYLKTDVSQEQYSYEDKLILHSTLLLDSKASTIICSYNNIIDVFEKCLFQFIFFFLTAKIVLQPYVLFRMRTEIMQQVFKFETAPKEFHVELKLSKDDQRRQQFMSKANEVQILLQNNNIDNDPNYVDLWSIMNSNKTLIGEQNCYQYFKSLFQGNKQNPLAKGFQQFEKKLNICNILNKIQEIDKLKALILTTDQLRLFDYIPQPRITHQRQKYLIPQTVQPVQAFLQEDERSFKEKINDVLEGFKNLTQDEHMGDLDRKLIDMIDIDIRNLLEATNESSINIYIYITKVPEQQRPVSDVEMEKNKDVFFQIQESYHEKRLN